MNLFRKIAVGVAAMAMVVSTVNAQLGFDTFFTTRSYPLIGPQNLIGFQQQIITNAYVDALQMIGVGTIDLCVQTNSGATGGTLTIQLQSSQDTTNWSNVAVSRFVAGTTQIVITNGYYQTVAGGTTNWIITTNNCVQPGTTTYPAATTAFYVTPYLTETPATNTFPTTVTTAQYYKFGFIVKDQSRYLRVLENLGGTTTNWTVNALLTVVQATQ